MLPLLLPWLGILALLALRPNRGWSCWWIWLPLGVLAFGWDCAQLGLQGSRSGLPKQAFEAVFEVPRALAFGVAAAWLLAPWLVRGGRHRTFLCLLIVVAAFGGGTFALNGGWVESSREITLQLLAVLVLLTLSVAAGPVLAGVACRGRCHPMRICLALCGSLLAVCLAVLAPFCAVGVMNSAANGRVAAFLAAGLLLAALSFLTLLPFLVLSFTNVVFRERLQALLFPKEMLHPALI